MKKIYGFAALCAAMSLASCSNDNEPNGSSVGEASTCYFSVNIAAPLEATRADFGTTDAAEYAVKDVKFVVFDKSGNVITTFTPTSLPTFTPESNQTGNLNSKSDNILVEVAQEGNNKVGYVMTLINAPSLNFTKGTSLATVRKTLLESYTSQIDGTDYFVMSNSAYNSSESLLGETHNYIAYATSLEGYVRETSEIAEANPVQIYVERVAARVDVKKGEMFPSTFVPENTTISNESGEAVTFTVDLDAVDFIYDPVKAYLVKDIDNLTNETAFDGWDDSSTLYRTHWANPANLSFKSEAEIAADQTGMTKSDYRKVHYSDITKSEWKNNNGVSNFYLNENVTELPTYVVLTGTIKVNNTATPVYLLYQNGKYYTQAGALKQMCQYLDWDDYNYIWTGSDSDEVKSVSSQVAPEDVEFQQAKDENGANLNYGYIVLKSTKVVNKDGKDYTCSLSKSGVAVKANELNAKIGTTENNNALMMNANKYLAYCYGGGRTYFYKEIQASEINDKTGVVRNHLYKITFNGVQGLGVPNYNPSDELVPRTITTNENEPKWFFDAKINILNWKVYSQGITFGE